MVTTLLCMVPPSVGSGWQTMATSGRGAASPSGGSTATSSRPAGPGSDRVVAWSGNGGNLDIGP